MPACVWAQEAEMDFVEESSRTRSAQSRHARPRSGCSITTTVFGAAPSASSATLERTSTSTALPGTATWASPRAMTRVHDAFPQKNAYWTEGGPDINQPDYRDRLHQVGRYLQRHRKQLGAVITAWNIALDEKGKPNVGPFSCGGVVTVESGSHKITRSGQYWAFAHYSRAYQARRTRLRDKRTWLRRRRRPVSHAGFRNPDGSHVVVLANRAQRRAQLVLGSNA